VARSPRSASKPAEVKGCEVPRVWTRPLRPLTRRTSLGFQAIDFCEQVLLMKLLPWQKWWLIHAFEVVGPIGDGNFRYRTLLTLVGRQSGKTTLLKAVSLWLMFTGRVRLVLGAAQSLDIARESWAGAVDMAEADPEMRLEIAPNGIRRTNGEQCLTLVSGARYRITAATRSAGRGLSVDLLILDELREHRDFLAWAALSKTTMARPNGITIAISNAGDDYSVVLNQLRDSATAGNSVELGIFEWSAPDGCAIDDEQAWAQGSPGLGYTIGLDAIRQALATDPPGVFRTEVLCQKVGSVDSPVPAPAWASCGDPAGAGVSILKNIHFCLDVAPDATHATLAAAGIGEDGKVHVGIVTAWTDVGQVRNDLPGLIEEHKPKTLGWFPGGPAAALMADLRLLRSVRKVPLKTEVVPAVCQGLAEQVISRQLVHGEDPLMTAHVTGSGRVPSGDGWRFSRKGGNADAAYASAGAVHLARTVVALSAKTVRRSRASA